jgi:rubredoxin
LGIQDGMSRWIALKARVDCPECGQPVLLDGPWAKVRCPSCDAVSPVAEMWNHLVKHSPEDGGQGKHFNLKSVRNPSWPVPTVDYAVNQNHPPICDCGAVLNSVAEIPDGTDATFHCPECGIGHDTFPPPRHLYAGVLQVFLAVRENQQGARAAVADVKPVMFGCPNCGANLKIHGENHRIVTCEYCEADAFLPAELWHRLHPVRKRRAFWLRCR